MWIPVVLCYDFFFLLNEFLFNCFVSPYTCCISMEFLCFWMKGRANEYVRTFLLAESQLYMSNHFCLLYIKEGAPRKESTLL